MKTQRGSILCLLLALLLACGQPAAAGPRSVDDTVDRPTLISAASSGDQPLGMLVNGLYVRLATPTCPLPARMAPDEPFGYICPPPVKSPPLPRR